MTGKFHMNLHAVKKLDLHIRLPSMTPSTALSHLALLVTSELEVQVAPALTNVISTLQPPITAPFN